MLKFLEDANIKTIDILRKLLEYMQRMYITSRQNPQQAMFNFSRVRKKKYLALPNLIKQL